MKLFFILLFLSPLIFSLQIEVYSKDNNFPFVLVDEIDYKVKGYKISKDLWEIDIWQDLDFSPPLKIYEDLLKEVLKVKNFLSYNFFIWSEDYNQILKIRKGNCISFVAFLEKNLKDFGFLTKKVKGLLLSKERNSPFYLNNLKATPHRWIQVFLPEIGWLSFDPLSSSGRVTRFHLPLKDYESLDFLKELKIEVKKWD